MAFRRVTPVLRQLITRSFSSVYLVVGQHAGSGPNVQRWSNRDFGSGSPQGRIFKVRRTEWLSQAGRAVFRLHLDYLGELGPKNRERESVSCGHRRFEIKKSDFDLELNVGEVLPWKASLTEIQAYIRNILPWQSALSLEFFNCVAANSVKLRVTFYEDWDNGKERGEDNAIAAMRLINAMMAGDHQAAHEAAGEIDIGYRNDMIASLTEVLFPTEEIERDTN